MSKKEKTEKETSVSEKEEKTEKEVKTKPKSKTKKTQPKPNVELYTLVELVQGLEDTTHIYMKLSMNGYSLQYDDELRLQQNGQEIIPSITKKEFDRIVNTKI